MRLINTDTLEFTDFVDPPPYAILSHRWAGHEITYEQYLDPQQRHGPGFEKVAAFCAYVKRSQNAVDWVWIDTCCIDKRSSAELSEAINSMWNWYWNSKICIAYLSDVSHQDWEIGICESEWLQRSWTLQELLSPQDVIFCDKLWREIGSKRKSDDLRQLIALSSRIPQDYLVRRDEIYHTSVAFRMSWASNRHASREEDIAYSLFGLFQVNLPLIYGEGSRAFLRLQEEIIRRSDDESILAWSLPESPDTGVLAPNPACFKHSGAIWRREIVDRPPLSITSRGLQIESALERSIPYRNSLGFETRPIQDEHRAKLGQSVLYSCMIYLYKTPDTSMFRRSHRNCVNSTVRVGRFDPTFVKQTLRSTTFYLEHILSAHSLWLIDFSEQRRKEVEAEKALRAEATNTETTAVSL